MDGSMPRVYNAAGLRPLHIIVSERVTWLFINCCRAQSADIAKI